MRIFFAGDFVSRHTTSIIEPDEKLMQLIGQCDYANVNFEVPLRPDVQLPEIGYERFFQHDDAPELLRRMGFNLFSIATNHTFDWGDEGYLKTRRALGDQAYGAGTREEAYRLKILEKDGLKVGLMAFVYAAKYGVFDRVDDTKQLGCAFIGDLAVNHLIMEAKKQVDYLIVLPHDGIEYIDVPIPEIRARYKDLIDYGADAVIGTHPHCPQGWEEHNGKPIFYSLGNFFFNSKEDPAYRAYYRPHWYEGLCVVLEMEKGRMEYRVVNTRNEGNLRISIDETSERSRMNEVLCHYLADAEEYKEQVDKAVGNLWLQQESVVLDTVMHRSNIKLLWKTLVLKTIAILLGKDKDKNASITALLKNDTRRAVARRGMENQQ